MNRKSLITIILVCLVAVILILFFGFSKTTSPTKETLSLEVKNNTNEPTYPTSPQVSVPDLQEPDETLPEGWVKDSESETLPALDREDVGNNLPATEVATEPVNHPTTDLPKPDQTEADSGSQDDFEVTYAQYMAMSAKEQRAYMDSFQDVDAFFAWFNAAKEAHERNQDFIEIGGDTSVDIGAIIGGNK